MESVYLPAGELRVFARAVGPQHDPILMVHGMAAASRSMLPLAGALDGRGSLIPDLPGTGRTTWTHRAPTVDEQADVLASVLDSRHLAAVDVIGNSSGTQTAVALASRHPDRVRRLVLVAPVIDPQHRQRAERVLPSPVFRPPRTVLRPARPVRQCWARARQRLARTGDPAPSLRALVLTEYAAIGLPRAAGLIRQALRWATEERLRDVTCPTLVVRGSEDGVVSPQWASRVAALLPQGKLTEVAGATHGGQYDKAPDIAAAIADFLIARP